MDLSTYSDGRLNWLRDWSNENGLPVEDIEDEIARRKTRKVQNVTAPVVAAAAGLGAAARAKRSVAEADGSVIRNDPKYIQAEQGNRSLRERTAAKNADTRALEADDKQYRHEDMMGLRWDTFDLKKEQSDLEQKYKNRKLDITERQNYIKDSLSLLEKRQRDVILTQSRVEADKRRLQQYVKIIGQEQDDARKQELMAEQNYYADQVLKGEQELANKQSKLAEYTNRVHGEVGATTQPAGMQPATQPTSKPSPATTQDLIQNSTPSPTSQPGAAPVAPQPQTQRVVIPTSRQAELRKYKREEASNPIAKAKLDFLRQQAQAGTAEAIAALAIIGE